MAEISGKTQDTVPDELIGSIAYRDDGACKSFFSIIRRLIHWGPITALFIIFFTSAVAIDCILRWWPPVSVGGAVHLTVFVGWVYLTLYNYINAVVIGPGWLPHGWSPSDSEARSSLQYCYVCRGYKAPRSHHCSACRRCVLKMDHHCPWINVCCGHKNHGYFILFLFFAVCGCMHALVIFIICLVKFFFETMPLHLHQMTRAAQRERMKAVRMGLVQPYPDDQIEAYYEDDDWSGYPEPSTLLQLSMWQLLSILFAVGLALGVVLAVGGLFIIQMRSVWRNRTGIEQYICEKAADRERMEAKRRAAAKTVQPPEAAAKVGVNGSSHAGSDTSQLRRRTDASRKPDGNDLEHGDKEDELNLRDSNGQDKHDEGEIETFEFPYDIDWRTNLNIALASALYPIMKPNHKLGVWWPVRPGCDQFTMTREQIKQKREKFAHTYIVKAVEPFHGSYSRSIVTEGVKASFAIPCCAGSLLRIEPGDVLLVTNWRQRWLFGRRLRIPDLDSRCQETRSEAELIRAALAEREELVATRERGWFAKRCVTQVL